MPGQTGKPRVLAFADVRGSFVAAARIHAPLRALHQAGLIDSYTVTDATLRGVPRSGEYDVVWLQRGADAWLARTLATRLSGRYLFDIDDHLLCAPTYLEAAELPDPRALGAALTGCRLLTTPSPRLAALLGRHIGVDLRGRTMVCANAVPFGRLPAPDPSLPKAILLTQGHRLALTASRGEVLTAIADGAARHRLPLWALGAVPADLRSIAAARGAMLTHLPPRPWDAYHRALAGRPTLLGVAPLETHGDAATVEFVMGKSDVKMVEYGGFGHPAVYSRAAPYEESDLGCGRLASNDYAAWSTAIDVIMEGGWRDAGDEARAVRERRELDRVALEQWWPAVQASRLAQPLRVTALLGELERVRALARDRVARARWRISRARRRGLAADRPHDAPPARDPDRARSAQES